MGVGNFTHQILALSLSRFNISAFKPNPETSNPYSIMAKDTEIKERDTRKLRDGYGYLRVEIPKNIVSKLNKAYSSDKDNDWSQLQARDDEIYKGFLKKMADNFNIGELSEDRASGPYGHLADAAGKYAEKETVTINVAFDKLQTLQENAMNRALNN